MENLVRSWLKGLQSITELIMQAQTGENGYDEILEALFKFNSYSSTLLLAHLRVNLGPSQLGVLEYQILKGIRSSVLYINFFLTWNYTPVLIYLLAICVSSFETSVQILFGFSLGYLPFPNRFAGVFICFVIF